MSENKRIAVRVTAKAQRQVRRGHPWVYDRSITKQSHEGEAGDLAVVFDSNRAFLAIGLFDPSSPIRVKIVHHGSPRQIDDDFWLEAVCKAMQRRSSLTNSTETNAYRCVNGENDSLPGLILDRYDNTYVLKLYSTAWLPHLQKVMAAIGRAIEVEGLQLDCLVLRLSRTLQRSAEVADYCDGQVLVGEPPTDPVPFIENGLRFEADVVRGQKTGHFLDQRDNRRRVAELSANASVLDVFCCTGGFSLHAAAGGASHVIGVDRSAHALETATRHFERNQNLAAVGQCVYSQLEGDAFDVMSGLVRDGEAFDVVVIDPPSFAQNQASVERALAAYGRLTQLGVRLVSKGGLLMQASCSSRVPRQDFEEGVLRSAEAANRQMTIVERTSHGIDHPVGFDQGEYLKAVFARLD